MSTRQLTARSGILHRMVLTTIPFLLIGHASPAVAQDKAAPPPCAADEYAQFDFWLGSWDVTTPDGGVAGTNTITREFNGCVLREQWVGQGGGAGESFNVYDPTRDAWHQTWVDGQGRLLLLDGGLDTRGRMVLRGERPGQDGIMVTDEITWELQENGTVLQVWSVSTDAGTSWREAFRGVYTRQDEY